jgi:hypothetical protein
MASARVSVPTISSPVSLSGRRSHVNRIASSLQWRRSYFPSASRLWFSRLFTPPVDPPMLGPATEPS